MKRIFYFTGHRFTVFHWDGKQFLGACSFEPDKEGFLKFEQYLNSSPNIRTKLLVDVIEEDFRIVQVPHVSGKDREAVLQRAVDKYYRSSNQYTFVETLWRQKTGRKDDDVLIGAITNPQLIQPWLTIILDNAVPLSGIWTLPLVSRDVLPFLNTNSDSVLVVSQQVPSNLRQSFFKNKKLISSRTSVINQEEDEHNQIGELANSEISRTLSYLRAQDHIHRDEIVEVHVLSSREQLESYQSALQANEFMRPHIHPISTIQETLGIKGFSGNLSDGIFSWLSLKKLFSKTHYGEPKDYKYYYCSIGSSALKALSLVTILCGVLITLGNISDSAGVSKEIELLGEQERKFKRTYDSKFKVFESVLEKAKLMKASVSLSEHLETSRKTNPLDFFIELSNTLSESRSGRIFINKISWTTKQIEQNGDGTRAKPKDTNVLFNTPIYHLAEVTGKIPVSKEEYRASVSLIESIVQALKNNPRIVEVDVIEMPVEVRSEKQFTGESGAKITAKQDTDTRGVFSLRVLMKGREDV